VADSLEELGFPSIWAANDDQRKRALEYVDNFVHAIRTALRESREDRGDFRGGLSVVDKPRGPGGKKPSRKPKKGASDSVSDSPKQSTKTKDLGSTKGHVLHDTG